MVNRGTYRNCLRLVSALLLSLCPASLHGADKPEAAWGNLNQLRGGQKIQVVHKNLKSQEGEFLRFSEEAISFRVKNDDVSVPRDEVLRITLREKHGRLRGPMLTQFKNFWSIVGSVVVLAWLKQLFSMT